MHLRNIHCEGSSSLHSAVTSAVCLLPLLSRLVCALTSLSRRSARGSEERAGDKIGALPTHSSNLFLSLFLSLHYPLSLSFTFFCLSLASLHAAAARGAADTKRSHLISRITTFQRSNATAATAAPCSVTHSHAAGGPARLFPCCRRHRIGRVGFPFFCSFVRFAGRLFLVRIGWIDFRRCRPPAVIVTFRAETRIR